jgi:hypothetical protein
MTVHMEVITPLGIYKVIRKDAIAITVVKVKRRITHHRTRYLANDITHIEHRKVPRHLYRVKSNCGGWAVPLATYYLDGTEIKLKDV